MDLLTPDREEPTAACIPRQDRDALIARPVDDTSALIRSVAAGDRAAFAILFRQFAPRIKAYLMHKGLEPWLADELAQDAMLTMWTKASLFDPYRASGQAWLFTIARNLLIDLSRRQRYAANLPPDDTPPVPQADAILEAVDSARHLRLAVQKLSPEQIEAVKLAFFDDYSHGHIEETLGIPLGTVKSRIRTAILKLRQMLENER